MASSILPIRFDIHAPGAYNDPPGIQLYAGSHGLLKGTFCRHVLHGTGGGMLAFDGDGPVADYAVADACVKVYDERLSSVVPWSGFFLDKSQMKVLSSGPDARVVQWGGDGLLSILARAALLNDWWDPNQVTAPGSGARGSYNADGYWTWLGETIGAILARGIGEGINQPRTPLGDVSLWDTPGQARVKDADGTSWTGAMDKYQLRIGATVLEIAAEAVRLGKYVQMEGDFAIKAYEAFGTDRSGAAFGAGVLRFEKGINVANDLDRSSEVRTASDVLVRGIDETYVQVNDPSVSVGRWEAIDVASNDAAVLASAGAVNLAARHLYGHSARFRLRETGDDEDNGIYLLGPSAAGGHGWVGDTARLHSGDGALDYNETDFPIAAVELRLDDAWETWVEAGSVYIDSQRRAFEETVRSIVRGPSVNPFFIDDTVDPERLMRMHPYDDGDYQTIAAADGNATRDAQLVMYAADGEDGTAAQLIAWNTALGTYAELLLDTFGGVYLNAFHNMQFQVDDTDTAESKFLFLGGMGIVFPTLPGPSDPADGEIGQVYYNESTNTLRWYDGSAWNDIGGFAIVSGSYRLPAGITAIEAADGSAYVYLDTDYIEIGVQGAGWSYFDGSEGWHQSTGSGDTDLVHNFSEGAGLVVPRLSADPDGSHSQAGQIYFNTTSGKFRGYDGSTWSDLS